MYLFIIKKNQSRSIKIANCAILLVKYSLKNFFFLSLTLSKPLVDKIFLIKH